MFARIRAFCARLEPVAQVLGVVASIGIAGVALMIEGHVQDNAAREARISRSVALSQQLFDSRHFLDLMEEAKRIETETLKRAAAAAGKAGLTDHLYRTALIAANGDRVAATEGEMRMRMLITLQQIDRLADCVGLPGLYAPERPEAVASLHVPTRAPAAVAAGMLWQGAPEAAGADPLCDVDTVMTLTGSALADVFFALRPMIECDPDLGGFLAAGLRGIVFETIRFEDRQSDAPGLTPVILRAGDPLPSEAALEAGWRTLVFDRGLPHGAGAAGARYCDLYDAAPSLVDGFARL
jgi:hypothetical protein